MHIWKIETSKVGLFYERYAIIDHSLLKVKFNADALLGVDCSIKI